MKAKIKYRLLETPFNCVSVGALCYNKNMKMQTLAQDLLSGQNARTAVVLIVFATGLGSLASLELLISNVGSIFGWLGFLSCILVYNLCFAVAIGDTKNWGGEITHNG